MRRFPWMYGIIAAVLFGLSTPFSKLLLGNTSSTLMAGLLYLGSGVGLSFWYWITKERSRAQEASLSSRDVPWLAGAIVFGGISAPILLLYGLSQTTAYSASLLLNLEGVLTAVIAWLFFKEHWNKRVLIGMACITGGGVLLSAGPVTGTAFLGNLTVVAACLCWAIDNNMTRNISAANPIQIAALKGMVAGACNVILGLTLGATMPPVSGVAEIVTLGLCTYGISLVFYILSLRIIGTARTGAYFSTAPFVGATVSWLLLNEPLMANAALAAILMSLGVWLHLTENHEHDHHHHEVTHEHSHVHDDHHEHGHEIDDPPGEPHSHEHTHLAVTHKHPHYPDLHHRHTHE